MRARHALLFAALVMLPDYSFAQRVTVSALTRTFEVASGLVSTQDTARRTYSSAQPPWRTEVEIDHLHGCRLPPRGRDTPRPAPLRVVA
jgi:hypothetical protein